jgi:DNA replication protein DnaC
MENVSDFAADIIAMIAAKAPKPEATDYIGDDGLIYCHKCHTRKQYRLPLGGQESVVPVMCECRKAEVQKEEKLRMHCADASAEMKREELKRMTFPTEEMRNIRFSENASGEPKETTAMRRYTDGFDKYSATGQGLLLWGDTGSGKTYASACIVNALTERGMLCRFLTPQDMEALASREYNAHADLLEDLSHRRLVVIDDLSPVQKSEHTASLMYSVVNTLYNAKIPIIITTNASLDAFKNPATQNARRICERILEKCFPVEFHGNKRRENLRNTYGIMKNELGL